MISGYPHHMRSQTGCVCTVLPQWRGTHPPSSRGMDAWPGAVQGAVQKIFCLFFGKGDIPLVLSPFPKNKKIKNQELRERVIFHWFYHLFRQYRNNPFLISRKRWYYQWNIILFRKSWFFLFPFLSENVILPMEYHPFPKILMSILIFSEKVIFHWFYHLFRRSWIIYLFIFAKRLYYQWNITLFRKSWCFIFLLFGKML